MACFQSGYQSWSDLSIYDPEELTNWFPDQAILEPRTGGKMKFGFYKKNSEKCDMDSLPEGTILEFTPNKKIWCTWEHPSIADFPRTVVTWELEKIDNNKTRLSYCIQDLKQIK